MTTVLLATNDNVNSFKCSGDHFNKTTSRFDFLEFFAQHLVRATMHIKQNRIMNE